NRSDEFGGVARLSGRTFKNPAARPIDCPACPMFNADALATAPLGLGPMPRNVSAVAVPKMCSGDCGDAVPMPTLPEALMSTLLVGAPGRMRRGRREPPVMSRTYYFASLAPISHPLATTS